MSRFAAIAARLLVAHLKQEPGKCLVAIFGLSLGIAVFTAIRLANASAIEALEASSRAIFGSADLAVSSPAGRVPEDIIRQIRNAEGVKRVVPYSSRQVLAHIAQEDRVLRIIGVDTLGGLYDEKQRGSGERDGLPLLAEPATALAPAEVIGDEERLSVVISGEPVALTIVGTLETNDLRSRLGTDILLMDIANFQELFRDYGFVNQFFIKVADGTSASSVRSRLQALLPAPLEVERTSELSKQVSDLTAAFRMNLSFLSGISLFAGMLVIFHFTRYRVQKLRRETATLLAIGATPTFLFRATMLELFFFGAVASAIGAAMGVFLGSAALNEIAGTINTLYTPIGSVALNVSASDLMQTFLLGLGVALLGGFLPSRLIFRVEPREILASHFSERHFGRLSRSYTVGGAFLLILGVLSLHDAVLSLHATAAFIAPTALLLSSVLLTPAVLHMVTRLRSGSPSGSQVSLLLATDHIRSSLAQSGISAATMMISVALVIGLSTMVSSFRQTVEEWIGHITTADIYIRSGESMGSRPTGSIPDKLPMELAALPEVSEVDWVSSFQTRLTNPISLPVRVVGSRFDILAQHDRLLFRSDKARALQEIRAPRSALVSEAFARRLNAKVGETVAIPFPKTIEHFRIAGVYVDYSSDGGVVMIDFDEYAALSGHDHKEGVSLYLKDGVNRSEFEESLRRRFLADFGGRYELSVRNNVELRAEVLRIFDKTFAITFALQSIALLISLLTIINNVLMLILDREREFGVLRAIGASTGQLVRLICAESLILAAVAVFGALVVGLLLALLLIEIINPLFFGWTMSLSVPFSSLIQICACTILIAVLASYPPALRFAKRLEPRVLRYE